eukprot:336404-Prymnesium_polylepis.1
MSKSSGSDRGRVDVQTCGRREAWGLRPAAPASMGEAVLDVKAMLAAKASSSTRPSIQVDKEDDLTYDLGLLYAHDPSPLDPEALAADPAAFLLQTARDNVQLLANKLYEQLKGAESKSAIPLPAPVFQLP